MRTATFFARLLCCCALAGCSHDELALVPASGSAAPLAASLPVRLTYNPGVDRSAAWLPDESALLYSADRLDRDDDDRCLVLLPPSGGQVTRTICATALATRDSTNTFDEAAVSPGGLVAFVRTSRRRGAPFLRFNELAVATFGTIENALVLHTIPLTVDSQLYSVISHVHWQGADRLVYRAGFAIPACIDANIPCARATIETGRRIMLQGFDDAVPVPGIDYVSSVAVRDGDELLFTLLGDDRIFSYRLSSASVSLFYSPNAGIVRDVQVAGDRLVAIVGGNVTVINPALNPPGTPRLQYDQGGDVMIIELSTGNSQTLHSPTGGYRRPALSPSGRRIVMERDNDLWLIELP